MKFGCIPLAEAEGATLAHTVQALGLRLKKGTVLGAEDIAALREAGIGKVTVARLDAGDVGEDEAARRLAAALVPDAAAAGLTVEAPFTGRVNVTAAQAGVFRVDAPMIHALNRVDPGITLATLPDYTRVSEGMMLATVKIIPYAVPGAALDRALAALGPGAMSVAAPVLSTADLILTRTPGFRPKLLDKGERVIRERLTALGLRLRHSEIVDHDIASVTAALRRCQSQLVLILGASATSDAHDVCPAGLVAAGGVLTRFGMPVDPGNLLFLGRLDARPVVGLPGCARSPAMNGADWVLERLVCGLDVGDDEISGMGVGGLLKEIPIRPHPRAIRAPSPEPRVEIILLAAGSARRMRGTDKLLEPVGDACLLRHAAQQALASNAARVHVVLPPDRSERQAALDGLDVDIVTATDAHKGMAHSLVAGMAALSDDADAVIVALADMPEIDAAAHDALIAGFSPESGHEICRAATGDGTAGHPVLFGRRFFENLTEISGDRGARSVLRMAPEYARDIPLPGRAAVTDLDTPEDWAAWRAERIG